LNGQEYDDSKALADETAGGIRADFQERGYFKVVVHDPVVQPIGEATGGKQRVLITASVTEGDQFRLRNLTIQSSVPNQALSIPAATLRDQFHIRSGDLFNMTEIRAGLERLQRLYVDRGMPISAQNPIRRSIVSPRALT
jgi:outer membrane protein assembly factor BamA